MSVNERIAKRPRVPDTEDSEISKKPRCEDERCYLTTLSDPELLLILRLLSSRDLLAMGGTCARLHSVCADKSLWKIADFGGKPLALKSLKTIIKKLNCETKLLAVEGCFNAGGGIVSETLSASLLADLTSRCPVLSTLVLDKCFIDASKVNFQQFPSSLTHLSVTRCEVINTPANSSYFKDINNDLPHLETLDLSYSGWLTNHSLMAICKCPGLTRLTLRGCYRIGECFAYTALATRFGFDNIEFFDLRDTEIGDSEVACFGRKSRVKVLLVGSDNPDNSDSKITDRAILNLCAEPAGVRLEELSVRGTKLTDSGLAELTEKFKLRWLDVSRSGVSMAGVEKARERLGSCRILSDF